MLILFLECVKIHLFHLLNLAEPLNFAGSLFHPGVWKTLAITGLWPKATVMKRSNDQTQQALDLAQLKPSLLKPCRTKQGLGLAEAQMCWCHLGRLYSSSQRGVSHGYSLEHQATFATPQCCCRSWVETMTRTEPESCSGCLHATFLGFSCT